MKRYAMIVPTSMGVRITPADREPVHTSHLFMMQATSAETNVATISSSLGLPVKVLTAFVEGSPIAAFIKADLRSRNLQFEGKEVEKGGPWGYRHQFNIADSGFGPRGPRVDNDRAGEVGRTLNADDFDLKRIFADEGAEVLHMSGLIAALSPETGKFCLKLAETAKKYGTKVSFDLNYRASFWQGREKELYNIFNEIASLSDFLIGNEEDFQLSLNIVGPKSGGEDLTEKIDNFKDMILVAKEKYPQARTFATTLRQVINANEHLWGAILLDGEEWHIAEPRPIQIYDRIGGGDGFVGGLLYGYLQKWPAEKCLQFGWATGALAVTVGTDYAVPVDEKQVWSIWNGNARVMR